MVKVMASVHHVLRFHPRFLSALLIIFAFSLLPVTAEAQNSGRPPKSSTPVFRPIDFGPEDTMSESIPAESFSESAGSSSNSRRGSEVDEQRSEPINAEPLPSSTSSARGSPSATGDDRLTASAEEDPTKYFEDLPGQTVTGVPRIMRQIHETEIFFTNLNQSYFIAHDNHHNRKFFAFEKAIKKGSSLSFRADPVSRRVLFVDGVDQASAQAKPIKTPGSLGAEPDRTPAAKAPSAVPGAGSAGKAPAGSR